MWHNYRNLIQRNENMNLTCTALLFDLDGVLIDSSVVVRRHWQKWAEVHQISFERVMAVAHGRTSVEIIRLIAPHLDAEDEGRRREAVEGVDTDGLKVYSAAQRILRVLPDSRWAVVTSGNPGTALTRLRYGSFPVPPVLITAVDVRQGKPAPEGYLLAAQRLGVLPAQCIVVEDAPAGIEAARAAGMRVIAVTTTHEPQALRLADFILREIADMTVTASGDQLHIRLEPILAA
jgi:sugar-phosphatase